MNLCCDDVILCIEHNVIIIIIIHASHENTVYILFLICLQSLSDYPNIICINVYNVLNTILKIPNLWLSKLYRGSSIFSLVIYCKFLFMKIIIPIDTYILELKIKNFIFLVNYREK